MAEPVLLYGLGATKAGTSWLYRTLADRADCALGAVKETHYWDTAEPETREKQLIAFERQLKRLRHMRAEAEAAKRGWQVRNMDRRISAMSSLIAMLRQERDGHTAYAAYLMSGADGQTRLVGDICPSYALLSEDTLREMAALSPQSRFLFLVRDPLARLWSAVRMQAERQLGEGEILEAKANNILWRILHRGQETHIVDRGDYAGTLGRLQAALPADRWRVLVMEELMTQEGYDALCAWLGLPSEPAPLEAKVHEGQHMALRDALAIKAREMLEPQYAFVASHLGRWPRDWPRDWSLGASGAGAGAQGTGATANEPRET